MNIAPSKEMLSAHAAVDAEINRAIQEKLLRALHIDLMHDIAEIVAAGGSTKTVFASTALRTVVQVEARNASGELVRVANVGELWVTPPSPMTRPEARVTH